MFASFTVVGFLFAIAWIQQTFLNRLISDDKEYLKTLQNPPTEKSSESQFG